MHQRVYIGEESVGYTKISMMDDISPIRGNRLSHKEANFVVLSVAAEKFFGVVRNFTANVSAAHLPLRVNFTDVLPGDAMVSGCRSGDQGNAGIINYQRKRISVTYADKHVYRITLSTLWEGLALKH